MWPDTSRNDGSVAGAENETAPDRGEEDSIVKKPMTRICAHVPAPLIEEARSISDIRETSFAEEVRRALETHVAFETARLGIPRVARVR
jgi:hypothetical protein